MYEISHVANKPHWKTTLLMDVNMPDSSSILGKFSENSKTEKKHPHLSAQSMSRVERASPIILLRCSEEPVGSANR
jgi:hypothetical protein